MKNEVSIVMRNSPMVRGISDKRPRCWYVRGFMEGIVSAILGVEATAFEVACEASNRNHCEFKATWGLPSSGGEEHRWSVSIAFSRKEVADVDGFFTKRHISSRESAG